MTTKSIRDASLFLKGAAQTRDAMKKADLPLNSKSVPKALFAVARQNDEMKNGSKSPERQEALEELLKLVTAYVQEN